MSARQDFLARLFRRLDAQAIAWCVLRNYEDLLAEGAATDLDLILEKRDLPRFNETLLAAAAESGLRLVQRARFVNHSRVFWSQSGGFIRVDFETEVRWRLFPVLSARAILQSRQRRENLYLPHPRHESVVLFAQAIWTGQLTDRYRRQLVRLHEACADKDELRRTYEAAFGGAGADLAAFHAHIAERQFDAAFCSRLKRALFAKTLTRPSAWPDFAVNTLDDAARFWQRLRQPPGISLLYVSSLKEERHLDEFMRRVEFLFPAQKSFVHQTDNWRAGRGLALECRRLRVLFKGGMFVQCCQPAADAELPKAIENRAGALYRSRCFICAQDSQQKIRLAHVGTGSETSSPDAGEGSTTDLSALLIGFIATVLERKHIDLLRSSIE